MGEHQQAVDGRTREVRIDCAGTQPHYLKHLAPIWAALPEENRGGLLIPPALRLLAASLGMVSDRPTSGNTLLAAGWSDVQGSRSWKRRVLLEHGVGQTYGARGHAAYAGGKGRAGRVELYLCPNERVATANKDLGQCIVVGSPYFDQLSAIERRSEHDLAVVTHHWNCAIVPETLSTRRHYATAVSQLIDCRVARHAHPRDIVQEQRLSAKSGVPFIEDFEDVVRYAGVLVCDNSSVMFYAAALGIPVVVLNAPWYCRSIEYGLRFWEHADIGENVDEPSQLQNVVSRALSNPPQCAEAVSRMKDDLLPTLSRPATQLAIEALLG